VVQNETAEPALDPEWDAMVLDYARQLPERVATLAAALADARAAGTADALVEPRRLAHRLYGTSGSYGLEAFSGVAARIEDVLVAAEAEGALDAPGWEAIAREVGALRELAESTGRGASSAWQRSSSPSDE
jgi:chemotaxis protein histidine kinase CheA